MPTLRFILGDQLNRNISSLQDVNKTKDIIFMCEVCDEATYVKHHKKKILFLFSAMRHFAEELKKSGFNIDYVKLDDKANCHAFTDEVASAIKRHKVDKLIVTFPGEYRVLQMLLSWQKKLNIPVEIRPDERFLSTPDEFNTWAKDRKQLRMENFYRLMRQKHNILMRNDKPIGGKWNYDIENRKTAKSDLTIPQPFHAKIDSITKQLIPLIEKKFNSHFGDLQPFHYAVTRKQALQALDDFIKHRLKQFGDYQDAMLEGEPWMFHSHISLYLNCGLLEPLECIAKAEQAYHAGKAPLNAVEGFIRQILGWREYIRGIYWLKMPSYATENFFAAKRKLPEFYWTANTKMNCLKQCIAETRANAYAHHIQRLMVLGNFALISGIDPKYVNEWYLIVYADAYQWVELPNVTGMILFADGGFMASKPYAAGGAYINKMSNYCKNCHYKVTEKTNDKACPFNYLYWDFLIRNQSKLKNNQRLRMIYSTLSKMSQEKINQIIKLAKNFLQKL
ncbi:MAG: cryptochrome/photolyase family protein [Pseudomonadota bacterium]